MTNRKDRIFAIAKGYFGKAKNCYSVAKNRGIFFFPVLSHYCLVEHGLQHAYIARRTRKREFRSLWTQNINASTQEFGVKYSQFMHGMSLTGCQLNRKMLAELAQEEPMSMRAIVEMTVGARKALAKQMPPATQVPYSQAQLDYAQQNVRCNVGNNFFQPNDDDFVYVPFPVEGSAEFEQAKQDPLVMKRLARINEEMRRLSIENEQEDAIFAKKLEEELKKKKLTKVDEFLVGDA